MFWGDILKNKNKNPLAKIWLCAHFDKKLSKLQILSINVSNVCENLMEQNNMRYALRLIGHLLLGVSRVNFLKASYLYAECSDVLSNLRVTTILEDPAQLPISIDTIIPPSKYTFDPEELFNRGFDKPPAFSEENITLVEIPLPININDERDTFGVPDGVNLNFPGDSLNNIFQTNEIPVSELHLPRDHPSTENQTLQEPSSEIPPPQEPEIGIQPEQQKINQDITSSTLIPNDIDEFVLPTIELIDQGKKKKGRKIIIDREIIINCEDFKEQIHNPENNTLILAPPNKFLMKMQLNSIEHGFLQRPGLKFLSSQLVKIYNRHLVTKHIENSPEQLGGAKRRRDEEASQSVQPQKRRAREEEAVNLSLPPPQEEIQSVAEAPLELTLDVIYPKRSSQVPELALQMLEEPPDLEAPSTSRGLPSLNITVDTSGRKGSLKRPRSSDEQSPKKKRVSFSEEDRIAEYTPEASTSTSDEVPDDIIMSRTQSEFLRKLQPLINAGSPAIFQELVQGKTKKQVARDFFTILTLHKDRVIHLKQDTPFSSIKIFSL